MFPTNLHTVVQVITMTDMTPTTRTRRDATENRVALLDAARVVLNRDPDASLETIATEAGLSRRSVYGHFANREELLRELIARGAGTVGSALQAIDHPDPVVRLALVAAHFWSEVRDIRLMTVIAVRGPLKQYSDESLRPMRETVLATITAGVDAGSVRSDIPAPLLARLVEDNLIAVLDESNSHPLDDAAGHRLAILTILGTLGFGWREAGEFIDAHDALSLETTK